MKLIVEAVDIVGSCPVYEMGNKIVLDDGFKLLQDRRLPADMRRRFLSQRRLDRADDCLASPLCNQETAWC